MYRSANQVALIVAVSAMLAACSDGPRPSSENGADGTADPFREVDRVALDTAAVATIGRITDLLVLDERLVVSDRMTDRVLSFTRQGDFLTAIGGPGDAPGEFRVPRALLEHRDGSILVAEPTRLTRLDRSLELVDTHRFVDPDDLEVPSALGDLVSIDGKTFVNLRYRPLSPGGHSYAAWDPETGLGESFHPWSELYQVPYWSDMQTRIAVGERHIYVAESFAYPIHRYDRDLQPLDTVGHAPPSWRQARKPELGEFARDIRAGQEWLRTFTTIDGLFWVDGGWLVVTHRDRRNEYRTQDEIRADVYRTSPTFEKVWEDVALPGPVHAGGACAWTVVEVPPEPWTLACLRPRANLASRSSDGGDPDAPEVQVRDSSGIRLVESSGPQWTGDSGWTVGAEPIAAVGREEGPSEYLFQRIIGAGRLPDGNLFVAEYPTQEIRLYGNDGDFLRSFGGRGRGPGEFRRISRLGVGRGDTIFVYDMFQQRMSFFSLAGELERTVALQGRDEGLIYRAAWLPDGRIVGATRVSPEEGEPGTLAQEELRYVLFDEEGEREKVFAAGPGNEYMLVGVPTGGETRIAYQIPLFAYRAVGVATERGLYMGLSRRREIGVMGYDGVLREIWRDLSFDPTLSEEAVKEAEDALMERAGMGGDRGVRPPTGRWPAASAVPPYSRVLVDPEGFLWMAEFDGRSEDARTWIVFDPEGRLLGNVRVPEGFRILSVGEDEVLGRAVDEHGVEALWVLRLERTP